MVPFSSGMVFSNLMQHGAPIRAFGIHTRFLWRNSVTSQRSEGWRKASFSPMSAGGETEKRSIESLFASHHKPGS
jgi:hypothetical protein